MNSFKCYVWMIFVNFRKWKEDCRHVKAMPWLEAIYSWAVCLWNQFFILNVTFLWVLHCRLAEIFCWNIHGDFFALPWYANLIGVRGKEDGWRLSAVCCQGTWKGCSVVLYWREMFQIGNSSSQMNSNPDIPGILINIVNAGGHMKGIHK